MAAGETTSGCFVSDIAKDEHRGGRGTTHYGLITIAVSLLT